jgi:SAM-dependent methyltransferase
MGKGSKDMKNSEIQMPMADKFGFVKTFNNTGYMTTYLDEVSEAWAQAVWKSHGYNADVGAAFGVATLRGLEQGAAKVIAIDVDKGHLRVIEKEAAKRDLTERLITLDGDFPNVKVKDSSLDNILICRVLHFFDGQKLQEAINWCFSKLVPGGKVFLVNETPYLRNFQTFIPIYEKRRSEGAEFPGFIEDVRAIAPERAPFLPPQMHLLDAEVLSRVCAKAGFVVERTATIPRPNFPVDIQLDGRESVGVIAKKPI